MGAGIASRRYIYAAALLLWALPAGAVDPRIIGGEEAAPAAWPWQVSLGVAGLGAAAGHYCGGALVDSQWVITVAHCLLGPSGEVVSPEALRITAGTNDLSAPVVRAGVSSIRIHPDFDPVSFNNDLALLRLDSAVECGQCESITLLSPSQEAMLAAPGTLATVTGWGDTNIDPNVTDYSVRLQQVEVPIVDNASCASVYAPDTITATMLCAGVGGKDSCQGDSGGPLVVPNSEGTGYLLAGIVSFGHGCADPAYPGVYTRAASYTDWVNSTTSDQGGGGGAFMWNFLIAAVLFLLRRRFA